MPLIIPLPPLTARWVTVPDGTPDLAWRQYLLAADADIRSLDALPAQVATNTSAIATLNTEVAGILAGAQIAGALVASPGGISNTGGLMLGLSNLAPANIITPKVTGRVFVMASGVVTNGTTGDGAFWHIRMGTGTAPANGAALTGTQYGGQQNVTVITGVPRETFGIQTIVTGLALNTAAWIDLVLGTVTGGTATMMQVNVSAFEI